MELYEHVRSIGSGNFGQVTLVRHREENEFYVIKKVKAQEMPNTEEEATEQEVRLLQSLQHPNIVSYKDSFIDSEKCLCIVMVYCEGGDMYTNIRNAKGKNFPEPQIFD